MRTAHLLFAGGAALAGAFVLGPSPSAAPPSASVTITNTPLPVTGTVGVSGPVTATLSGTPTVSATVTNTATNPVPVTNGDRPTAFNQSFTTSANNLTSVPVPAGCRLVIHVVTFWLSETPATDHMPLVVLGGAPLFVIPTNLQNNGGAVTSGALAAQIIVDSPTTLNVVDLFGSSGTNANWAIGGYLLPLTPGASC
jgi:hypothetical protein